MKTPDGFQKISSFHLHFYGVKHDCPTQTIRVEQSQSDRSKKPFHPVLYVNKRFVPTRAKTVHDSPYIFDKSVAKYKFRYLINIDDLDECKTAIHEWFWAGLEQP